MLIRNVSALLGQELDFTQKINLQIQNDSFKRIQSNIHPNSNEEVIDGEGITSNSRIY